MKFGDWGYLVIGCLLGISTFLSGCSDESVDSQQLNKNIVQDSNNIQKDEKNETPSLRISSLFDDVKKVTIITQDGSEINVEQEPFLSELDNLLATIPETEKPVNYFVYTVILWTKQDEPVVMQVGNEGIKIGDTFLDGTTVPLVMELMNTYAGSHYFSNLTIDRIMISARDLGQTKQFNGEQVELIAHALKNAQYIKDEPRIKDPLFPYYVLELDVGGKQIIEIDVLSPTLLSVDFGEESSYYQLEESLFGPLKEEIPLMDYTPQHIKYLYKANEMKIIDLANLLPKPEIIIGGEGTDPLEVKSITHYFSRLLSSGAPANVEFSQESPSFMLQYMIDGKMIPVAVYPEGFIYKNQAYIRENIQQDITDRVLENF